MRNYVYVQFFDNKVVSVDSELFYLPDLTIDTIKSVLPDELKETPIFGITWKMDDQWNTGFTLTSGGFVDLELKEENYNKYIKPYVDIWQAEKDRIEQEQADIIAEQNKFENRQARALVQLNQDFETAAQRAHVKSSLGFEVDANSTANENVNGLLITIGSGTVDFCDYYNQFHELNKAQLETLQSEIIQNGQSLYAQKWQYRTAIQNCSDNEQLDAVLETIEFTYMDFTPQTDQGESQTE